MKSILPLITLVAASSALAQTAPNVAKKPALQHSVEVAYITSSFSPSGLIPAAADDFAGYHAAAKAYVWNNVFLVLEHTETSADFNILDPMAPDSITLSRLGYGFGASFDVGPGSLNVSYTHGRAEYKLEGGGASQTEKSDQGRANLTYSQAIGAGFTAALGVTQFFNDEESIDDTTALILTVGYDFRNGLSVFASYSPDSADLGVEEFSEDAFSLGAKYSF